MNQEKRDKSELRQAVALSYDQEEADAPVVKAKGKGSTAEEIIALAEENGVPIQEDPALVELLAKVDVEEQIPPELYAVIAEVLAMIYQLEKKAMHDE